MGITQGGVMYEGPDIPDEDIVSIYVIVNGSLGMTPGKIAAQVFHAATNVGREIERCMWSGTAYGNHGQEFEEYLKQGRRVVVRVAETKGVFMRAWGELGGFQQIDEGLTQVDRGSHTCFATYPIRRGDAPKILSHKRIQLLK